MVTPRGWPESYGGAEEQCYKQAELLSERGWNVRILTSKTYPKTPSVSRRGSIAYVRLPISKYPDVGRFNFVLACIWLIRCIFLLRRRKVDVIHSHQAKVHALVGCFFNAMRGTPHFVKIGNSGVGFDLMRLSKRALYGKGVVWLIVRYTSHFIAISKNIEMELECFGISKGRITYIPNCVHVAPHALELRKTRRFDVLEHEGINPEKRVFAVVGRLESQKLVQLTLESFLEAAKNPTVRENAVLCFVGDGVLQAELERLVDLAQAHDYVRFLGRRDDVPDLMHAFDVLLLISKSEGLSNSLLEAMAAGCVPIASKLSGNVDLIDNEKNGFLVENKIDQISGQITNFSTIPKNAFDSLSKHAYVSVSELCSRGKIAKKLDDLAVQLLSN